MNINAGWLVLMLLGSGLGFVYFNYGRKNHKLAFILFGLGLMMIGYFFDSVWALTVTTVLLAAGPFAMKKR